MTLEGTKDGREVREIDLDRVSAKDFKRFLENVTERRLRSTEALQQYATQDLRAGLRGLPETVPDGSRARSLDRGGDEALDYEFVVHGDGTNSDRRSSGPLVVRLELQLILAERKARRNQLYVMRELEPPEPSDSKTEEAARLFGSKR